MNILVVDDEKLIVKGLAFALEQDGNTVDTAFDGEEAVDRIRENAYDIVLLDLMLPKLDGYEVCKTVTNALIDRPGAGAEAVKSQFERFRTVWGTALEKARAHGDARNIVVEETKLAALEDVIAHFPEAEK